MYQKVDKSNDCGFCDTSYKHLQNLDSHQKVDDIAYWLIISQSTKRPLQNTRYKSSSQVDSISIRLN